MAWSQESATSKWGEETEEGRQHPFLYDTYQTFSKLCLSFSLSFSLYLFLSATSRMLFKNASCKNLPVLRPLVITKAFFLLSSILSSFLFLLLLLLLNLLLSFGQCWSRSFILYIHILSTFDVFCQFQCLQSIQNQKNNIKMVYTSYKKSFV